MLVSVAAGSVTSAGNMLKAISNLTSIYMLQTVSHVTYVSADEGCG